MKHIQSLHEKKKPLIYSLPICSLNTVLYQSWGGMPLESIRPHQLL